MDASPDRHAVEWCEIRRWRGYVASTFYAIADDGRVLAESKSFRSRRNEPGLETAAARAAYDSVVEAISAAGWTPAEERDVREDARFTRPLRTSPELASEPPPLDVPAVPSEPLPEQEPDEQPEEESTGPAAAPTATRQPADAAGAVPSRQRRRALQLGMIAAVITAGVAAAVPLALLNASHSLAPRTRNPTVDARSRVPTSDHRRHHASAPKANGAQPNRASLVTVRIAAHGNGSWLEVRRRSAAGPLLYQATLLPGEHLHFRGARLWARFGAAGNLAITADGRAVALSGTQEKVFVP